MIFRKNHYLWSLVQPLHSGNNESLWRMRLASLKKLKTNFIRTIYNTLKDVMKASSLTRFCKVTSLSLQLYWKWPQYGTLVTLFEALYSNMKIDFAPPPHCIGNDVWVGRLLLTLHYWNSVLVLSITKNFALVKRDSHFGIIYLMQRKSSWKTNISYPLIRTRTCAYLGGKLFCKTCACTK